MKLRSLISTLALIFVILVTTGFSFGSNNTSSIPLQPKGAIFVGQQAPVMVSLLNNPESLAKFWSYIADKNGNFNKFKQSFLNNTGLDYQKDVKPWLGNEITLAVTSLDFDHNPSNGQQPGYLLILNSKNQVKSKEFLQLFWQKQSVSQDNLVFDEYEGVKIIYSKDSLASAIVGQGFVLFANDPKVLREAINNVQANINLNDSASYQKSLQTLTSSRLGLIFFNLPEITTKLGEDENSINQYQGLGISISLTPKGLELDTALLGKDIIAQSPLLTEPVPALKYLPEQSNLVASGVNLNQLLAQLTNNKLWGKLAEKQLQKIEQKWDIKLNEDLAKWATGEYALGIIQRPNSKQKDWIFITEKNADVQSGIDQLDLKAKNKGFSLSILPLGQQNITAWTKLITTKSQSDGLYSLIAQVEGVHTTLGKYEIFTSSVETMDLVLKSEKKSILNQENFANVIKKFPPENDGYLYINWQENGEIITNEVRVLRLAKFVAKPFFEQLRSLVISSYGSETGIQRSKVFLQFIP